MAVIPTSQEERVLHISRWLGLNESAAGDANIKAGEGSKMRNFRVTDDGALQVRPGFNIIAGLLSEYNMSETEETLRKVELNATEFAVQAYPQAYTDSVGVIRLGGEARTLNFASSAELSGYYAEVDGEICRFAGCEETLAGGASADEKHVLRVDGGAISWPEQDSYTFSCGGYISNTHGTVTSTYGCFETGNLTYPDVKIKDGELVLSGGGRQPTPGDPCLGYFYRAGNGAVYKIVVLEARTTKDTRMYGAPVSVEGNDEYAWTFNKLSVTQNESDTVVRGLWSGWVGGVEYLVAACNGHLFALSEADGAWSKADIGLISTTGRVLLFGFGGKLYAMTDTEYRAWDGIGYGDVLGYIPCVATATPPAGGGTLLERVNKLTASKRQQFSADGTATAFVLAERDIASVDAVTVAGAAAAYTADLEAGTVTFPSPPQEGVNNVEITWTGKTSLRSSVLGMRYSELFNGANDNRVFLYGDGTENAIYSGLDVNGNATAEYFPDMNEIKVGGDGTPLNALIRHYDQLLALKEGSAYTISFGTVTLADSSVTAGFYLSPINREVGCCARGQAVLVENSPFVPDGQSIYRWKASGGGRFTDDRRNAEVVSQRASVTLGELDLQSAVAWYDKAHHEYFLVSGSTGVIYNTVADAWYVWDGFPATCLMTYKGDLYFGAPDGCLRRASRDYRTDDGAEINAQWESGAMSFGADWRLKHSPCLWLAAKPETDAEVCVTLRTDNKSEYATKIAEWGYSEGGEPKTRKVKLKAKKFAYYRLCLSVCAAGKTATIISTDILVRYAGAVRR